MTIDTTFCPACGTPLVGGASFCWKCGAKQLTADATLPTSGKARPTPSPSPQVGVPVPSIAVKGTSCLPTALMIIGGFIAVVIVLNAIVGGNPRTATPTPVPAASQPAPAALTTAQVVVVGTATPVSTVLVMVVASAIPVSTATVAEPTLAATSQPTATALASLTPDLLPSAGPKLLAVHKVGEDVTVQETTVRIVGVRPGPVTSVELLITNTGSQNLDVSFDSTYLRDGQGYEYSHHYPDVGGWFEGTILPGDKLRGTVEFNTTGSPKGLKFYYERKRFSPENTAVFALDDQSLANPWPKLAGVDAAKSFVAGTVYSAGDAVNLNGFVVRLVEMHTNGNVATFKVILYNGSPKDEVLFWSHPYVSKDAESNQAELKDSGIYTNNLGAPGSDIVSGGITAGTLTFEYKKAIVQPTRLYVTIGDQTVIFTGK